MPTQTITIPAREVRPGDVLFGMTVTDAMETGHLAATHAFDFEGEEPIWMGGNRRVTVERPVSSDPIGTVRADNAGTPHPVLVLVKVGENEWEQSGSQITRGDSYVSDLPILWKPGMPIPTEGVQA